MSKSTFWAFFFFMISVSLVITLSFAVKETDRLRAKQAKIKPCKCLTYRQLSYYSTKYDIYMDSLNYSSRKNRPRLEDSVRKFGQILRKNY